MVQRRIYSTLLMIVIVLAGCWPKNRSDPYTSSIGSTSTKVMTNSTQSTIETEKISTLPAIEETAFAVVQSSPNQDDEAILLSPCLDFSNDPLEREKIPWDLLVEHSRLLYLYDPQTDIKIDISQISGRYTPPEYFVSSDGKWLSYQDATTSTLYIEPVDNLQKNDPNERIEWKKPLHYLEGWFTESSLVLTRRPEGKVFMSTVIFNPFSGEEHEYILEDLPNYKFFKAGGVGAYMFGHSNIMPDPSLTRLVYPGLTNNGQGANIVLWDIANQDVLLKMDKFYESIYNDPLWSRDGNNFLIINVGPEPFLGLEWFQVSRNGSVKQITHFGEFLEGIPGLVKGVRSPDGNYLTFQIQYDWQGQTVTKYLVIDLRPNELNGFCIDSTPIEGGEDQAPVWSPDSRFLAVSNTRTNSMGELILVDVQTKKLAKLTMDMHAIGWIENPSN